MKFGEQLASKIYEPWRVSYLQYNQLKVELKRRQLERGWFATDEVEFSQKIESELSKVYRFIQCQLGMLNARAEQNQVALEGLMNSGTTEKKKYDAIDDVLTEILFDTNDLARFHQLNVSGFTKIIKKHDRYTQLNLQESYHKLMSSQWPLDKLSLQFDVLIVKISELHDICHLHGNPRSEQNAYNQGKDQTAFERATAKYWVHPDNITEVKSIILFHLPVHVFNQNKQYEESDMAVSSVYFDNDKFDLYSGRLSREEGSESIRLRWYGHLNENNSDVYVERKTHKAAWLNGKSVKDRFRLKEHQVNPFLTGKYTANHVADELRKKNDGKPNMEAMVKESHFIANGVQNSVEHRSLNPMCRVFYNRTAFQLPGDQRLRISLDSNLTFIREDGKERHQRLPRSNQLNWKRNDVGIDYPFRSMSENDISRFPYAVLETKLQTHLGQKCPTWLTDLIDSHLVHEVPRFSKYLHGASILFGSKVPVKPYWLEEFGQDIRKPPIANIGLSRSLSSKPLVNGHHRQSLLMLYEQELQNAKGKEKKKFGESLGLGDLRIASILRNTSFKKKRQDNPHLAINLLDTTQDSNEKSRNDEPKDVLARIWNYGTPISTQLSSVFKHYNKKSEPKDASLLPRTHKGPEKFARGQAKKTEPKTFFANERTFISWLQFCALLLTVALNLLNNGDHISRVIGAVFIIISSLLSM